MNSDPKQERLQRALRIKDQLAKREQIPEFAWIQQYLKENQHLASLNQIEIKDVFTRLFDGKSYQPKGCKRCCCKKLEAYMQERYKNDEEKFPSYKHSTEIYDGFNLCECLAIIQASEGAKIIVQESKQTKRHHLELS
jgi:hypothetical protein